MKASKRRENESKIAENKIQALGLIEFCEKWNLIQQINEYTRQNRILDLFLTNSDIVSDISYISHEKLSDHDTMVIKTKNQVSSKSEQKRTSYYTTKNLEYNIEKMTSDQILNCKIFLESYDWTDINSVSLLTVIEEMLEKYCSKKEP